MVFFGRGHSVVMYCISVDRLYQYCHSLSWVLCLFQQVQASNDSSLLCYKFFFICSYSMSLLFIQSIIVSLCLPRVLVPSILPSNTVCRMDSLLNTWPNQFFCLCWMVFIKLLFSCAMVQNLDWIGVQSNWFSLPFSKSTFQTIAVVECPPSSTSMFLRHTIPYSKSESLLFYSLTPISSFFSIILRVY